MVKILNTKNDNYQQSNRWKILGIFFGYVIYVYNKKSLIPLFTELISEFGFSEQDAGFITSAQQVSISVVTFLGGILTDYLPSTFLFSVGLLITGITTLFFPSGTNVYYFATIWLINGIGHGLELPTAIWLTKHFSTKDTFATNWSFVMTAVNIAGIITPTWSIFLSSNFGWKMALYISGTLTFATGLVMLIYFREESNLKTNHQKENEETIKKTTETKMGVWDLFIFFPPIWIVMINRFVVGLYRLSVHDWSQLFFASFHQYNDHNNQYLASIFITVFESSSIFGKLLFGKINDYFMRKKLTLVNNRGPSSTLVVRLSIAIGLHLISAFALFLYCNLLSTTKNISIFVLVAVIAGISSAGNVITLSILSTEIGDEKYQGLITSLCNLATKLGALCSGYPFTLIAFLIGWHGAYTFVMIIIILTLTLDMVFHVRCNS
uniref:Glucose-6-phosphate exchanger SLC37A4-like n=1 Tax=Dermatophagoides pteronyssinus TaxID=6956 RepID=A0A6P6Y1I1_DERPT|nr:glucose-6-phosphate exchanger SLC37A4-like [Dermatophagoides pteronyssinus]